MAECSGGKVRNATSCACECPTGEAECNGQCLSITCPGTGGVVRDPVTCECVECNPGEVFCGGECRPECSGGRVRNAATCACECPQGEVFCGQTGNERCVSNQCGSGGRTFNPATCQCECPPTQPVTCGGQCRAECPSGQLRDPVTCQCVARCSAANCEGCCGTDASGAVICRRGTTNANCGSDGGVCTQCTGSATCNQVGTIRRCCIAAGTVLPLGQTCTPSGSGNAGTNALCCSGQCRTSNRQCL